jgi:hypothetical protein
MNHKLASVVVALTCLPAVTAWGQEQSDNLPPAPPPIEEMPAAQPQTTQPDQTPTLDNFREALQDHGQWVNTPEHGEVWSPSVDRDWRPYSRGRWVNTEYGWTFVADESWGWAPFHYGRWVYYPPYGWVWIPGYEWAPSWVTWRYGPDYIGWAPLGPYGVGLDYYAYPSIWFCVPGRYFHHPGVHRYFVPTARVPGIMRTTYFPGVPRRGFYYSPPAPYVALASHRPVVRVSAKGITPSWVPRGASFRPAAALRAALRSAPIVAVPRGSAGSTGSVRGVRSYPGRSGPATRPGYSPRSYRSSSRPPYGYRAGSPPWGRSYSGYGSYSGHSYRGPSGSPAYRGSSAPSSSRGQSSSGSGSSSARSSSSGRSSGGTSRGHR